jgi:Protein of unknown function (DUF2909)
MTYLVALAFVAILGSLATALFFMVKKPAESSTRPRSKGMAWALAMRVGLSVALFLLVLLAYHMGWIQPTGLPVR